MFVTTIAVLGLCLGSFTNAVVWRLHKQRSKSKKGNNTQDFSISRGRSMCPHCRHTLQAVDLIPVLSWVWLRGKCRYCNKPISWQYPVIELLVAGLFVCSYVFWPYSLTSMSNWLSFGIWLACVVIMVMLSIYDIIWMLLPDVLVLWLTCLAIFFSASQIASSDDIKQTTTLLVGSLATIPILFWALYKFSKSRWIGYGDVKLAPAMALLAGTPFNSLLLLFLASFLGSCIALPGLLSGRLKRTAHIPFGPFLLAATFIVVVFGNTISDWLNSYLLLS